MILLDRLPYATEATLIDAVGERIRAKPYQIIVQVSISLRTLVDWDSRTPRFPVILDSGYNHNLSIRRDHLVRWAGLQSVMLPIVGAIRERQQRIPLRAANLWVHANVRGEHRLSPHDPYILQVRQGIAIYPDETGPRIPVLGLRALTLNKLHLTIDGERHQVSLRTIDWRASIFRWVS